MTGITISILLILIYFQLTINTCNVICHGAESMNTKISNEKFNVNKESDITMLERRARNILRPAASNNKLNLGAAGNNQHFKCYDYDISIAGN